MQSGPPFKLTPKWPIGPTRLHPYMTVKFGLFITEKKVRHEAVLVTRFFFLSVIVCHSRFTFSAFFLPRGQKISLWLSWMKRIMTLCCFTTLHLMISTGNKKVNWHAILFFYSHFFLSPNTVVCPFYLVETIISWRDPEKALELALSFQEAESCSFIW